VIEKRERRGRAKEAQRPQKNRRSLAFCETIVQVGKLREGRVAMIFWVSRETEMT
jgi:hypothetical protein